MSIQSVVTANLLKLKTSKRRGVAELSLFKKGRRARVFPPRFNTQARMIRLEIHTESRLQLSLTTGYEDIVCHIVALRNQIFTF